MKEEKLYEPSFISVEVSFGGASAVYERENCKIKVETTGEGKVTAYGKLVVDEEALLKVKTLDEFMSLFKEESICRLEDNLGRNVNAVWTSRLDAKDITFPVEEEMEYYFASFVKDTLETEKFLYDIEEFRKEHVAEKIIIWQCFYNEERPNTRHCIALSETSSESVNA